MLSIRARIRVAIRARRIAAHVKNTRAAKN